MKKTLIIFFCSLVLFSCERGPYIEDYKIEGIALGDSLLKYLSIDEIKKEIEINKHNYDYLREEFGEVYLFDGDFEVYDSMTFFVKPSDKKYIIYQVRGNIVYDNKIEECYKKQKELIEEFSLLYNNAKKINETVPYPFDPTGISNITYTSFAFKSGDQITVSCKNIEKNFKKEYSYVDGMSVSIERKEIDDWLSDY